PVGGRLGGRGQRAHRLGRRRGRVHVTVHRAAARAGGEPGEVSDTPVLAVVGAINVDLVVAGAPLPVAGETVVGGRFHEHQGGKGGNQAVAAARALGDVGRAAMIGAVGDDVFGAEARAALAADGVDVTHV